MKIQFRRPLATGLATTVLKEAEPAFTRDTHELVIGDGETEGGIPVAMDITSVTGTRTIKDGDGVHYHHITLVKGFITDWLIDTNP